MPALERHSRGAARQLAPGKTAQIDLPIYANSQLDGTALAAGDKLPLWSLDEQINATQNGLASPVLQRNTISGWSAIGADDGRIPQFTQHGLIKNTAGQCASSRLAASSTSRLWTATRIRLWTGRSFSCFATCTRRESRRVDTPRADADSVVTVELGWSASAETMASSSCATEWTLICQGRAPVSSSNSTTPSEYTSLSGARWVCSGLAQSGVSARLLRNRREP